MQEVEQSQYFVSFVAHRSGWHPEVDDVTEETMVAYPWLQRFLPGMSVTELEVYFGCLGCGVDSPCRSAFLYVRDPAYLETVKKRNEDLEAYQETEEFKMVKLEGLKKKLKDRYDESVRMKGRSRNKNKLPVAECYRPYS